MTVDATRPWDHAIRRKIYSIIGLMVAVTLAIMTFKFIYERELKILTETMDRFHLQSTLYYIKALDELSEVKQRRHSAVDPESGISFVSNVASHYHLANRAYKKALSLEAEYQFEDHNFLVEKLVKQLAMFARGWTEGLSLEDFDRSTFSLEVTTKQLLQTHAIARDENIETQKSLEERSRIAFLAPILALLALVIVLTKMCLNAIDQIICERLKSEKTIRYQAQFDYLTDLPNRRLALERLHYLIEAANENREKVAVLFLDLDDFKKINDTLGHAVGDELLVEAANRLQKSVRSNDVVGRLGGDEFIIILGQLKSSQDIDAVVDSIIRGINEVFTLGGRHMILTASIGISVYPGDGIEPATLLRHADTAMYNAKKLGRDTFSYFDLSMNRRSDRRLAIEEQIHGALKNNELSVCYQAKVNLLTQEVMGAEALLRWNNPVLGQVEPSEFIPIAERTGLIVGFGRFILQEAIDTLGRQESGLEGHFQIAINLSPRQFRDAELVPFIQSILKKSGVSGDRVELEITEGVLLDRSPLVDAALKTLKSMGVSLAMDDFGTGYSSLSYLRRYPFDIVKIDKSFIQDLVTKASDRELISATIALAHCLNTKVVAEGVENREQLDFLKDHHCDYAQGYFFNELKTKTSKPA